MTDVEALDLIGIFLKRQPSGPLAEAVRLDDLIQKLLGGLNQAMRVALYQKLGLRGPQEPAAQTKAPLTDLGRLRAWLLWQRQGVPGVPAVYEVGGSPYLNARAGKSKPHPLRREAS